MKCLQSIVKPYSRGIAVIWLPPQSPTYENRVLDQLAGKYSQSAPFYPCGTT